MPIASRAKIFTKPKSFLNLKGDLTPQGSLIMDFCYLENGQPKRKLLENYVKEKQAEGLEVYYENLDGSKGRLK